MKLPAALRPESMVGHAPGVIVKELQGTVLVAAVEGGRGHCMDPIGLRIWNALERPRSIAGLVDWLCAQYAVDPAACQDDTTAFIGDLLAKGLVVVYEGSE